MSHRSVILRGLGIGLASVLLCAIFASELPELFSLTDNTANDFTMRSPIPLVSPVLDGARNVRKATIQSKNPTKYSLLGHLVSHEKTELALARLFILYSDLRT